MFFSEYHIETDQPHLCYSFKELCHCAWPNYYRLIIHREAVKPATIGAPMCTQTTQYTHQISWFSNYKRNNKLFQLKSKSELNGNNSNSNKNERTIILNVLAVLGYDCANSNMNTDYDVH